MVALGSACGGPGAPLGMHALRSILLQLCACGALAVSKLDPCPRVDTRKQFVRLALLVDDKRVAEAMQVMRNPQKVDADHRVADKKIKAKTKQLLAQLFSVCVEGGGTVSTFALVPTWVQEVASAAVVGRLPGTPTGTAEEKQIVGLGERHAIYR